VSRETLAVPVTESTQVGEARRRAAVLSARAGHDETTAGRVALVVTELGTNLVRHGGGGEILLRAEGDAVEVIALDRGPGMEDVARCLRDGVSSAGSPGTGLGAVRRLADAFDVFSAPGRGTVVVARLWPDRAARAVFHGAVSVAMPGEDVCGDAWAVARQDGAVSVLVVDGLGHGPLAAAAAHEATRVFAENDRRAPGEILESAHRALRSTRGAAGAVLRALPAQERLIHAGVGNVSGFVAARERTRALAGQHGTLGHVAGRVRETEYPWAARSLVVLHSDGLGTHWTLEGYPGIWERDPAVVAALLYRDHRRGTDDATVVVLRHPQEPST
jgi:anti-sigma regulatory factor (Ser/Thr protein kinase)